MFKQDMIEHVRASAPKRPERVSVLYFITAERVGFPVKIGRSNSLGLHKRIGQLQIALPYKVTLLFGFEATPDFEREVQDSMHEHHLRGEWFERSREMQELIDDMTSQFPDWLQALRSIGCRV